MKEVIRAVEALGIRFDELKFSTASRLTQMRQSIRILILGTWYSRQWGSGRNYHLFSNA